VYAHTQYCVDVGPPRSSTAPGNWPRAPRRTLLGLETAISLNSLLLRVAALRLGNSPRRFATVARNVSPYLVSPVLAALASRLPLLLSTDPWTHGAKRTTSGYATRPSKHPSRKENMNFTVASVKRNAPCGVSITVGVLSAQGAHYPGGCPSLPRRAECSASVADQTLLQPAAVTNSLV
jgi:hypothetical protein